VDRIRVDKFKSRDLFCLENILIRSSDFLNNEQEFKKADEILLQERQRYSQ